MKQARVLLFPPEMNAQRTDFGIFRRIPPRYGAAFPDQARESVRVLLEAPRTSRQAKRPQELKQIFSCWTTMFVSNWKFDET
jgi:hypothetical protein